MVDEKKHGGEKRNTCPRRDHCHVCYHGEPSLRPARPTPYLFNNIRVACGNIVVLGLVHVNVEQTRLLDTLQKKANLKCHNG